MEYTETEMRRHALEQDLKEAILKVEIRKLEFTMAKSSGVVPEEKLQELAIRVDIAVNTAWDITQLIGSPAY